MSKNFELLQRAGRAEEMLVIESVPFSPRNGNHHKLDAEALEHEEIVKLVQRLFSPASVEGPRVVVFSGFGEGSGSSRVCALVGQTLAARATGTVCVVDANLRTPSLHVHFDAENLTGLADGIQVSTPIRNMAIRIAAGNLWLIPAGPTLHNGSLLMVMDRLKIRIQELRQEFDYVLINAPATDRYTDPVVLARTADGLILVIEANSTPRATIERAKASLMTAEIRLLGAVLNNRTFPIPQSIYERLR